MQTIPVEQANGHLDEIINKLPPGGEIVITRGNQPIATLKATQPTDQGAPKLGTLKGSILYLAPDFDAIPEGFEEYVS